MAHDEFGQCRIRELCNRIPSSQVRARPHGHSVLERLGVVRMELYAGVLAQALQDRFQEACDGMVSHVSGNEANAQAPLWVLEARMPRLCGGQSILDFAPEGAVLRKQGIAF